MRGEGALRRRQVLRRHCCQVVGKAGSPGAYPGSIAIAAWHASRASSKRPIITSAAARLDWATWGLTAAATTDGLTPGGIVPNRSSAAAYFRSAPAKFPSSNMVLAAERSSLMTSQYADSADKRTASAASAAARATAAASAAACAFAAASVVVCAKAVKVLTARSESALRTELSMSP